MNKETLQILSKYFTHSVTGVGGVMGVFPVHTSWNTSWQVPIGNNFFFDDWIPKDGRDLKHTFCGVDRTIDPVGLMGQTHHLKEETPREAILSAANLIAREGGMADICFMPQKLYDELTQSTYAFLYTHGFYVHTKVNGILLISLPCLKNDIYVCQTETWRVFGQSLVCTAPGYNVRILLDGASSPFLWEAWWNQYNLLVLLRRKPKLGFIRKLISE